MRFFSYRLCFNSFLFSVFFAVPVSVLTAGVESGFETGIFYRYRHVDTQQHEGGPELRYFLRNNKASFNIRYRGLSNERLRTYDSEKKTYANRLRGSIKYYLSRQISISTGAGWQADSENLRAASGRLNLVYRPAIGHYIRGGLSYFNESYILNSVAVDWQSRSAFTEYELPVSSRLWLVWGYQLTEITYREADYATGYNDHSASGGLLWFMYDGLLLSLRMFYNRDDVERERAGAMIFSYYQITESIRARFSLYYNSYTDNSSYVPADRDSVSFTSAVLYRFYFTRR